MINVRIQENAVQKLSPKITVIGVGGAGGNAVNNMIDTGLGGVEFLVCNTDSQALEYSSASQKVQLGTGITGGLGAGSKPDIGRAAAEESLDEVMNYLEGSNMVFVTAGMGGGTGTGAAPVIARAAREAGILTVGVVTKPFHFEGGHRMRQAETGLQDMQDYVDTLIVIPNQNLFRVANEKTTFADAFKMADGVLQSGVRGVTDLMVMPGLINLDFADVRTAMLEMGKAMMGTGEASGENRAIEAAEAAINNPLLDDVSMKGARGVIINITGGMDMTLFEADEACNRIRDEVDPEANIIFGSTFDEKLDGTMRVSVVATGIDDASGAHGTTRRPSSLSVNGFTPANNRTVESNQTVAQASAHTEQQPVSLEKSEPVVQVSEQQQSTQEMNNDSTMRGHRIGNAFIPPRAVEAASVEKMSPSGYGPALSEPQHESDIEEENDETQGSDDQGQFQPSAAPQQHQGERRSPSLFERLTGSKGEGQQSGHMDQQASDGSALRAPARSPYQQGSLNIEGPAKAKEAENKDDLEIPAFLRRQAN